LRSSPPLRDEGPIELLLCYFNMMGPWGLMQECRRVLDPTTLPHGRPAHPCLSQASAGKAACPCAFESFQNPSRAQLCPGGPSPPPRSQLPAVPSLAAEGPGSPGLPTLLSMPMLCAQASGSASSSLAHPNAALQQCAPYSITLLHSFLKQLPSRPGESLLRLECCSRRVCAFNYWPTTSVSMPE
jgi:hypothetical protein